MENKRAWIALVAVVAALAGAAFWYLRRPAQQPPPVAGTAPVQKPADAPIPAPEKSDSQIRADLGTLSTRPEWTHWLTTSDLLDRFVVIVDNVAEGVNPRKQLDFIKVEPQQTEKLDTARYDRIADVIASVDAKGAAQVVRSMHPLLESAYHKLGYPDRKFDQVAAKALQRIVDAPVQEKASRLVPKGGENFAWSDPKLEALGPVEKLLLRMGPRNTKLIQNKAREIAAALDFRIARH